MRGGLAPLLAVFESVLLTSVLGGSSYNSYAGPYDILFKETGQCVSVTVDQDHMLTNLSGNLQYSRPYKSTVYHGTCVVAKDIHPGSYGVKVSIAKWDNVAGWRENFFRIDGGELCAVIVAYARDTFVEIHRNNPKMPATCPIHKGFYMFRNFSMKNIRGFDHFPIFPYGKYRGELLFYDMKAKQDIVGCFLGSSEVVPKMKKS